jgi:hypothetical protein
MSGEGRGPFWYVVVHDAAVMVRAGLELSSDEVRTISPGTVFEATERRHNSEGVLRLRVEDGWVSERLMTDDVPGAYLVEEVAVPLAFEETGTLFYRVIYSLPIPVRAGLELGSEGVGEIEAGATFKATERRLNSEGVMRLRVDDGWVSERVMVDGKPGDFLVEAVENPQSLAGAWQLVYRSFVCC